MAQRLGTSLIWTLALVPLFVGCSKQDLRSDAVLKFLKSTKRPGNGNQMFDGEWPTKTKAVWLSQTSEPVDVDELLVDNVRIQMGSQVKDFFEKVESGEFTFHNLVADAHRYTTPEGSRQYVTSNQAGFVFDVLVGSKPLTAQKVTYKLQQYIWSRTERKYVNSSSDAIKLTEWFLFDEDGQVVGRFGESFLKKK